MEKAGWRGASSYRPPGAILSIEALRLGRSDGGASHDRSDCHPRRPENGFEDVNMHQKEALPALSHGRAGCQPAIQRTAVRDTTEKTVEHGSGAARSKFHSTRWFGPNSEREVEAQRKRQRRALAPPLLMRGTRQVKRISGRCAALALNSLHPRSRRE